MSAQGVISQGRAFTERLMASTCRIARVVGTSEDMDEDGNYGDIVEVTYEGPCKVKFVSTVNGDIDAQSQFLTEQTAVLSLPVVGSEGVDIDDVAEITANPMDTGLIGKRLRVTGFHGQTFATARRFQAELST